MLMQAQLLSTCLNSEPKDITDGQYIRIYTLSRLYGVTTNCYGTDQN